MEHWAPQPRQTILLVPEHPVHPLQPPVQDSAQAEKHHPTHAYEQSELLVPLFANLNSLYSLTILSKLSNYCLETIFSFVRSSKPSSLILSLLIACNGIMIFS